MKKELLKKIISILEIIQKMDDIELIQCTVESLLDDLKDSKKEKDESKK